MQQPNTNIPEDILCLIIQQIMTDPVMLMESGHTYEKEAILKWFEKKDIDPATGRKIIAKTIAPNIMARKMVTSFLETPKKSNSLILEKTYLPESLIQEFIEESIEKSNGIN